MSSVVRKTGGLRVNEFPNSGGFIVGVSHFAGDFSPLAVYTTIMSRAVICSRVFASEFMPIIMNVRCVFPLLSASKAWLCSLSQVPTYDFVLAKHGRSRLFTYMFLIIARVFSIMSFFTVFS